MQESLCFPNHKMFYVKIMTLLSIHLWLFSSPLVIASLFRNDHLLMKILKSLILQAPIAYTAYVECISPTHQNSCQQWPATPLHWYLYFTALPTPFPHPASSFLQCSPKQNIGAFIALCEWKREKSTSSCQRWSHSGADIRTIDIRPALCQENSS